MEQKFIDLLVDSTREVFETMSFLAVMRQPLIHENTDVSGIHLTATVTLAGEISGFIALHSTRDFVRKCISAMSDREDEITQGDLLDTAGEISNMIAGSMKRRLSTLVDLFYISLPSVLSSSGHTLHFNGVKEDFPRLLIPFISDEQDKFYVEMLYHKR